MLNRNIIKKKTKCMMMHLKQGTSTWKLIKFIIFIIKILQILNLVNPSNISLWHQF